MSQFDLTPAVARRALKGLVPEQLLDDDAAAVDRFAIAVWNHLTEPGDGTAGRLIAEMGATRALASVLKGSLRDSATVSAAEQPPALKRWSPRLNPAELSTSLRLGAAARVRLITPGDPEWPSQLDDLQSHTPLCLWTRGDASVLARLRPSLAIVGARAATSYGEHVAMDLAADLAGNGIPIVSGAAYGIDGAAHRAALAVGGLTVALLAGGVERAYPVGHSHLIELIAANGVVVSEVPCGSMPTKWRFLQRNRVIAAVAEATIVVEAGWRSGSLNTASHAASLGRPLGAVPGPITSAASAGSHRLLREYAAACITSGDDARELIGRGVVVPEPQPHRSNGETRPDTDDRTRVRDALSGRVWRDSADLARRSGMAQEDVESVLGLLLLESWVERNADGWRRAGSVR